MATIAVTGGSGFIGANLVRTLVGRGNEVRVIDNLSTGHRSNLDGVDADLIQASILDGDALDQTFAGVDAIVHLAAIPSVPRSVANPVASHHANATGTLEVLEAARRAGSPHTIVASSSSVYGANQTLPKSEDLRTHPISPYAVSKQAGESYALAYAYCYGLPVLPFRFFNVYGPLQPAGHAYAAAIPTFIHAALSHQPIPVHGDGKQTRDFTFVGSVAAIIAHALETGATSDMPVNLAFGSRLSVLEVIDAISDELGHELEIDFGPPLPGEVRDSQADRHRLDAIAPDVEPVAFEHGLRETIAWFQTLLEYQ